LQLGSCAVAAPAQTTSDSHASDAKRRNLGCMIDTSSPRIFRASASEDPHSSESGGPVYSQLSAFPSGLRKPLSFCVEIAPHCKDYRIEWFGYRVAGGMLGIGTRG
jgi:hypothetical protein